ncbi:hypothetical protein JMUB6875_02730 [Nocardia sp. JMUB6875]
MTTCKAVSPNAVPVAVRSLTGPAPLPRPVYLGKAAPVDRNNPDLGRLTSLAIPNTVSI